AESSLLVTSSAETGPVPVDDAGFLNAVFASVAGGIGPEPSQLATVYFGAQLLDLERPGLYVLDWDVHDLASGDLAGWWRDTFAQIDEITARHRLAQSVCM